jgi:hypothetical protein
MPEVISDEIFSLLGPRSNPNYLAQSPHYHGQTQDQGGTGQPIPFICLYIWLEKYFSRGHYQKKRMTNEPEAVLPPRRFKDRAQQHPEPHQAIFAKTCRPR